jgi:IS5 family transposase
MIKVLVFLVLVQWHGLFDHELGRQITDRISFRKFLSFPNNMDDFGKVWAFSERLSKTDRDKKIWQELQQHLDSTGLKLEKGVILEATFIIADPGHAKAPCGDEAKTRRSKDGTWTKKNTKSCFRYKFHSKDDIDYGLIRGIETTTESGHDNPVDLTKPGEVSYKDKGYFGTISRGFTATMRRSVRSHPIGIRDILRNKRISRKRATGESPCTVLKMCLNRGIPWLV